MNKLAIFLPTYKRPDVLQAVATHIEENTKNPFTLYFGLEPDDTRGIEAAKATGHKVVVNQYEQGYSNTIQTIYENSEEPFFLHANDDFQFHKDWDEVPLSMFTPPIMVVGLKQSETDNHGSAISMIAREYIEKQSGVIDIPNRVFYPYGHNYCDTELTRTAQKRGVWGMCGPQVITHMHPGFTGKDKDDTHRKNDAKGEADRQTFEKRVNLLGF